MKVLKSTRTLNLLSAVIKDEDEALSWIQTHDLIRLRMMNHISVGFLLFGLEQ